MVFRILFGAFFGAVFGYIAGLIIEMFPAFNGAFLWGMHALTGIGDVRTAALFAAVGFIGGIVFGAIAEVMHGMWHYSMYKRYGRMKYWRPWE